jgi:hypothetical protein
MRVFFSVRKSVVHPVHDGISLGYEVRRSLRGVCQKVKDALPEFVHREHFMRGVPVMKKGLEKD